MFLEHLSWRGRPCSLPQHVIGGGGVQNFWWQKSVHGFEAHVSRKILIHYHYSLYFPLREREQIRRSNYELKISISTLILFLPPRRTLKSNPRKNSFKNIFTSRLIKDMVVLKNNWPFQTAPHFAKRYNINSTDPSNAR